jgi:hypothetical protein
MFVSAINYCPRNALVIIIHSYVTFQKRHHQVYIRIQRWGKATEYLVQQAEKAMDEYPITFIRKYDTTVSDHLICLTMQFNLYCESVLWCGSLRL